MEAVKKICQFFCYKSTNNLYSYLCFFSAHKTLIGRPYLQSAIFCRWSKHQPCLNHRTVIQVWNQASSSQHINNYS